MLHPTIECCKTTLKALSLSCREILVFESFFDLFYFEKGIVNEYLVFPSSGASLFLYHLCYHYFGTHWFLRNGWNTRYWRQGIVIDHIILLSFHKIVLGRVAKDQLEMTLRAIATCTAQEGWVLAFWSVLAEVFIAKWNLLNWMLTTIFVHLN